MARQGYPLRKPAPRPTEPHGRRPHASYRAQPVTASPQHAKPAHLSSAPAPWASQRRPRARAKPWSMWVCCTP